MKKVAIALLFVVATVLLVCLLPVGWALKRLYGGSAPSAGAYGNCWAYAIPRWLQNPRRRYLVVRMSRAGVWPHVMFAHSIEELEIEEFAPVERVYGWRGFLAAFWFRGGVAKGKGEQ